MTFDVHFYRDKQHTLDRFNVVFVVTLTEYFYYTSLS